MPRTRAVSGSLVICCRAEQRRTERRSGLAFEHGIQDSVERWSSVPVEHGIGNSIERWFFVAIERGIRGSIKRRFLGHVERRFVVAIFDQRVLSIEHGVLVFAEQPFIGFVRFVGLVGQQPVIHVERKLFVIGRREPLDPRGINARRSQERNGQPSPSKYGWRL